jgi:hypothetical protein
MGRTNPTFREVLSRLEGDWQPYRRGLRHTDQAVFDRLFEHARRHADACGLQNHPDPLVAVLLSIHLEQAKRLDDLQSRVAALEREVATSSEAEPKAEIEADAGRRQ